MQRHESVTKEYSAAKKLPYYGSINTIAHLCGRGKTVLDVGCSTGYLGNLLKQNNNTVYGIDGNSEALERAKDTYTAVQCVDLNGDFILDFKEKFDIIVFADVLEHLVDPQSVLVLFKKFLKPNGRIIVSLPNVALWRVRFGLFLGQFNYTDYGVLDRTHLHLYTFNSAKKMLCSAGYLPSNVTFGVNLRLFGILIRYLPFLRNLLSIHIIIVAGKE